MGRGRSVSKETDPSKRMEMCKKCPHLWKNKICKKCGCVMPIKVKIKAASCPIGNW